jgi:hypothetical protein
MGFSGRCEAIKAPTTENDTIWVRRMTVVGIPVSTISYRVCPLRRLKIRHAPASATHSRHSDQASHAARRVLISPTPRSCSLAPSVTTPLYNTTVCQALRQTQRSRISKANFRENPKGEVRRIPILRPSVNKRLYSELRCLSTARSVLPSRPRASTHRTQQPGCQSR